MYIIFIVPLNKRPGSFFNMVDESDVVRIFHSLRIAYMALIRINIPKKKLRVKLAVR